MENKHPLSEDELASAAGGGWSDVTEWFKKAVKRPSPAAGGIAAAADNGDLSPEGVRKAELNKTEK